MKTFLYEEAGEGGSGGGGGDPAAGAPHAAAGSPSLLGGQPPAGGAPAGGAPAQTAANTAPYFVGLWDTAGKIDKTRLEGLPAHLKPYKDTFGKYETADQFMAGYANLVQLAGKKGLQPLPPDSPPEAKAERAALMRTLNNAPEKPEGYGIKKPAGMPDAEWNGEYVNTMLGVLHKHNASPEQVRELFEVDTQHAGGMKEKSAAEQTAALAREGETLRTTFGSDYDKKIAGATRAALTLGLDVNDPMFGQAKYVVAMAKMADMISEDRLVSGDGAPNGGNDRQRALDIITNAANPLHKAYHNTEDPGHKAAVEQVSAFNQRYHAQQRPKQ